MHVLGRDSDIHGRPVPQITCKDMQFDSMVKVQGHNALCPFYSRLATNLAD